MLKLVIAAVLLVASPCLATKQCNLYNFGVSGAYSCGLQWWQAEDLGQVVDFELKLSEIVIGALEFFQVPLSSINDPLNGTMGAESVNPFAKILESAATVEPYVTFGLADLILGQGLTVEELARFGLPAALADKTKLIEMYTNYFDFSCGSHGVGSFVTCMNTWVNDNCAPEDEGSVIVNYLTNFRDAYCNSGSVDQTLINSMNADVGTVFSSLLDFMGIYKNPEDPYLFNISMSSWVFQQDVLESLGVMLQEDCGYIVNSVGTDLPMLVTENATVGAGVLIDRLLRFGNSASRCVFRVMDKQFPTFFEDNKVALDHLMIPLKRYGMDAISTDPTNVATIERATVAVFGDPHMLPYKATKSVTCSAIGPHNYLSNENFTLTGTAEAAGPNTEASWVKEVLLTFHGVNVTYVSGAGATPSNKLLVNGLQQTQGTNDIEIADEGEVIRITDKRSGAVFGFQKYRDTYFFTVRMGVNAFDGSMGLLTMGCPEAIDISAGGARRKRSSECETACQGVEEMYQDTCVFDCGVTGDTEVAAISTKVSTLTKEAQMEDTKILESLGVDSVTTTVVTNVDNSGSFVTFSLSMVVMLTAALLA